MGPVHRKQLLGCWSPTYGLWQPLPTGLLPPLTSHSLLYCSLSFPKLGQVSQCAAAATPPLCTSRSQGPFVHPVVGALSLAGSAIPSFSARCPLLPWASAWEVNLTTLDAAPSKDVYIKTIV